MNSSHLARNEKSARRVPNTLIKCWALSLIAMLMTIGIGSNADAQSSCPCDYIGLTEIKKAKPLRDHTCINVNLPQVDARKVQAEHPKKSSSGGGPFLQAWVSYSATFGRFCRLHQRTMNGTVIVDDGNVAKNNNLSESVADDCSRDVEAFGRSAAIALRSDEFAACFPDS